MVLVPFPVFEPDKSRFNGGASPLIVNTIPTNDGWGPLDGVGGEIEPIFIAIGDENGNYITDQDGNYIATGSTIGNVLTDENLEALTDDLGLALVDAVTSVGIDGTAQISAPVIGLFAGRKSDGTERVFAGTATKLYELNSSQFIWTDVTRAVGGNYAADGRWSFAQFGTYLYAANGVDAEQMIDLELGTEFQDNTTAPIARYLAVVGDFMFRGNVASYPYQIQNSAINNPQSNTATVDFSDYQDMPVGDVVMGIVPISGGAHVWMKSALHIIGNFFADAFYLYTRQTATEMRGTSSPDSIGTIAQDDYAIYCDDGFWRFAGGSWQPIGAGRVNDWFLTECDQDDRANIVAMSDPEHQIVWWAYTDTAGTRKMLGYDYIRDRWCTSTVSAQASARIRTFAYTTAAGYDFTGDLLRFAIVNESGSLAYLVGSSLAATIETNEISFNGPGRALVNGGRINGDPINASVVLETADYQGGTLTARSSVSPSTRTRFLSLRGDGRVHKLTISIPQGETWSTVTGIDVDVKRSGRS